MKHRRGLAPWVMVSLFLFFPDRAQAYVDPGTGSYVLQLILAGLLGALFALKVFWLRMISFFKNLLARSSRA